jgi:phospholipid-binding lipoprotein MlaA
MKITLKDKIACDKSFVFERLWIFILLISMITGCTSTEDSKPNLVTSDSKADRLPFLGPRRQLEQLNDPNLVINVISYPNYRDPLIGINRITFAFNDITYRYLLIPAAQGFTWITPDPVEQGLNNFFFNIKMPIYAVNHLLQFKFELVRHNLLRFGINSTIGLLGFFDPASDKFDLDRAETHFEDTLALYGADYGIYIVLPILGPSDVRNAISTITDYFLNPIPYLIENPERSVIQSVDYLQDFAPKADMYPVLRNKSKDPYLFYRNLYLQGVQRNADY